MIAAPWLALLPAAVFATISAATGSRVARYSGATWLIYCLYEYGMKYRVLCSGECNIRLDLFVIYPALLLVSAAAVVAGVLGFRKKD